VVALALEELQRELKSGNVRDELLDKLEKEMRASEGENEPPSTSSYN
jgi:hypothetical protein